MLPLAKMDKKEDLLQNFKAAIISTVKSISNLDDVDVVFGTQSGDEKN
jgi:hypothetical protein